MLLTVLLQIPQLVTGSPLKEEEQAPLLSSQSSLQPHPSMELCGSDTGRVMVIVIVRVEVISTLMYLLLLTVCEGEL